MDLYIWSLNDKIDSVYDESGTANTDFICYYLK